MTVHELNAAPADEFVNAIGWVFEHSLWVAQRSAGARPFAGVAALHRAMVAEVEKASKKEQLALLNAHPDLGTKARISDASRGEQTGAGLDQLTPAEYAQLTQRNAEYRERFGFPFLFAVKGSTKHDILRALDARRCNSVDEEFAEALRQVYRIARFRLDAALS